jgi:hypothetical protein
MRGSRWQNVDKTKTQKVDTPPPLWKCREVQGHQISRNSIENPEPYARNVTYDDLKQPLSRQHGLMFTVGRVPLIMMEILLARSDDATSSSPHAVQQCRLSRFQSCSMTLPICVHLPYISSLELGGGAFPAEVSCRAFLTCARAMGGGCCIENWAMNQAQCAPTASQPR